MCSLQCIDALSQIKPTHPHSPPSIQNNLVKAETRDRLKAGVAKGFMAEDIMAEIEADVWIEQGIGAF